MSQDLGTQETTYGQRRKAASIRDQSDGTDVAWVDFVIMHIYMHVRSCSCTISL
jgi:hypothetical protein